jgi:hypothetical protein
MPAKNSATSIIQKPLAQPSAIKASPASSVPSHLREIQAKRLCQQRQQHIADIGKPVVNDVHAATGF